MTTRDEIVKESVHESRNQRGRNLLSGLMAMMVAMFLVTGAAAWFTYKTYHAAAQRGTNLAAQVRAACADPKVDTTELQPLCSKADKVVEQAPTSPTVKGDKGDVGSTGAAGIQGPPPSAAEISAAVRSYCSTGVCRGTVTAQQVQQAVRLYCNNRGGCKGAAGATGKEGATGDKGSTGDPGATGPAGQDGKDGTNGTNGTDAVPFSFTFVVDSGIPGQATTYNCTVTDPATPATCTTS